MREGDFSGPVKGKTGFVFCMENEPYIMGSRLTGCQYKNGVLIDVFDGGLSSSEVMDQLQEVDLQPFNYFEEMKK